MFRIQVHKFIRPKRNIILKSKIKLLKLIEEKFTKSLELIFKSFPTFLSKKISRLIQISTPTTLTIH